MSPAEAIRHFGIDPKVALLSHSNFGSSDAAAAQKMREALNLLQQRAPELEVECERAGLGPEVGLHFQPALTGRKACAMSGYRDSMFWASDDEIAAYRERQAKASTPANEQEPVYTSFSYDDEDAQVYVDIREAKPVTLDGFSI